MIRVLKTFNLVGLPPDDEALRVPLRQLLQQFVSELPASSRARSWIGFDGVLSRSLGEAGYLGLTLPRHYGGQERGPFARFVVVEELLSVGARSAAHWSADLQSAPLILHYGTERQRETFLPGIAKGEIFFCIGMSEPSAGSDLAGVRSRATRSDGGWRLNGSKIWTTNAQHHDYMIALVRTSGSSEDRQTGLSQFIVDMRAPGVTVRPIEDLTGDEHFAEIFFEDVFLADDMLVGQEGAGWAQVTAELAFERSGPERIYSSIVLLDAWIGHLRNVGRWDDATTGLVGRLTAQLATLRSLSIAVTARLAAGEQPVVEASIVKDLGTSFEQSIPTLVANDLGSRPREIPTDDLLRTLFYLTQIAPSFSLRGGTREVLRGIIARGLGLR